MEHSLRAAWCTPDSTCTVAERHRAHCARAQQLATPGSTLVKTRKQHAVAGRSPRARSSPLPSRRVSFHAACECARCSTVALPPRPNPPPSPLLPPAPEHRKRSPPSAAQASPPAHAYTQSTYHTLRCLPRFSACFARLALACSRGTDLVVAPGCLVVARHAGGCHNEVARALFAPPRRCGFSMPVVVRTVHSHNLSPLRDAAPLPVHPGVETLNAETARTHDKSL